MSENIQSHRINKIVFGDACFILYHFNRAEEAVSLPELSNTNYHQHPFYEIQFSTADTMTFLVEEQQFQLHKGQAIMIAPGHPHSMLTYEAMKQRIIISFNMIRVEGDAGYYDYFSSLLSRFSYCVMDITDAFWTCLLRFDSMSESTRISSHCRYIVEAYDFIYRLMEEIGCIGDNAIHSSPTEKDMKYILENMVYDFRYSLSEIALRLGYSKRHISRLIHKRYGMSLSALRESIMFLSAKMVMHQTPNARMREIIEKSGFPSATALYRAFIKYEKCPPSEYMKRLCAQETLSVNG